jgi:hypothetical protein
MTLIPWGNTDELRKDHDDLMDVFTRVIIKITLLLILLPA